MRKRKNRGYLAKPRKSRSARAPLRRHITDLISCGTCAFFRQNKTVGGGRIETQFNREYGKKKKATFWYFRKANTQFAPLKRNRKKKETPAERDVRFIN